MRIRTSTAPLAVTLALGAAPPAAAQGGGLHAWELDRGESWLVVVTHRSGLLSFLGHEHAVVPGEWSVELCLADPVPAGARGRIEIPTAALVLDSDSARALAGLGGGPDSAKVRELQANMLDADHLDAVAFPTIRLEAAALEGARDGTVRTRVAITLHGVTREVEVPVRVEGAGEGRLRLSGQVEIRQRDFGIEPESIAGVVKVSDEVDLRFRLVAARTERACTPEPPRGSPPPAG
jgi:hypothetical protein